MTIDELHIQLDIHSDDKLSVLKDVAAICYNGYLFVDSNNGHCYLFDENGNEDDVKKLKKITNDEFFNCESLESIIIPDSVERIEDYTFYKCKSLMSIIIPDSVERIGMDAFWSCKSLKSLTFKGKTIDQVKSMENYPFGIEDESIIKCI